MSNQTVYIVTSGSYSDFRVRRVYLDREQAEAFVEARNKAWDSDGYEVEEWPVGGPQAEYDGPIWEGTFRQNRVEKQASWTIYDLQGMKGGFSPGWRELYTPREYTGEVKDRYDYHEIWHTGETPPKATVHVTNTQSYQDTIYAVVRGTSREHVEKSLQDTAARLKAEKAGIT